MQKQLCTLHVKTCSCVYADHVALFDEERNLDLSACLEGGWLGGVGSGIALEAGVGLGDLQLNEVGRLYAKDIALVGQHLAGHIFGDKLEVVAQSALIDGELLICFGIHEIIQTTILIKILHILALDKSGGELSRGIECGFCHCSCNNVAQLGADESRALAGLYVLKFDDRINGTVHLKCYAVSEIACYYHLVYLHEITYRFVL